MKWKNLSLTIWSLLFGAIVALAAMLLSSCLDSRQASDRQLLCSGTSDHIDCRPQPESDGGNRTGRR